MGTDIHAFVEVEIAPNTWKALAQLYLDRSYRVFFALGGVRFERDGQRRPTWNRGLPKDASARVRVEHAEWDSHDTSWATTAEVRAIDSEIADAMYAIGGTSPTRLVFWFDS